MKKKCLNPYKLIFLAVVSTSLFISSCSKEEATRINKSDETSNILSFKDMNEYRETRNLICSFTSEELIQYEVSKGYKSFGRICDELYSNIDPEEFISIDEIKTYVSLNSDYFQLIEEENGDLTFEKVLFRNPDRYLLNEDKMNKINGTVYKVFEDITVSTNEKNSDILKSININNIASYSKDPNFIFTSTKSNEISSQLKETKDYPPIPIMFCGDSFYDMKQEGRDRTKLWLNWLVTDDGYGIRTYQTFLEIKPYKKTIVWFGCSRTISWDIDWASDLLIGTEWARWYHHEDGQEFNNDIRRYNLEFITNSYNSFVHHFGGFIGWGGTPSAPTIYLNCRSTAF